MALKGYDYVVLVSILLLLAAHASTVFLITFYSQSAQTVEQAQNIVKAYEKGLIAKLTFQLTGFATLWKIIISPTLMLFVWIVVRQALRKRPDILWAFASMFLFAFSADFLHDFAQVAAILVRQGVIG